MAGEIQCRPKPRITGVTLYAQVWNSTGSVWNGSAFETYATANIANYAITMTEKGTASGFWAGTFPSTSAGTYGVVVYQRAGGSPAETDEQVADGNIEWDGSAVLPVGDVRKWNATAVATPVTAGVPVVDWRGTRLNTAQGSTAGNAVTLDASASATNSIYKNCCISILAGTGVGQSRLIDGYTGATKIASVLPDWTTQPSSDSIFVLTPGLADVEKWRDTAVTAPVTAGTPAVEWTPSPFELKGTATASSASTITLDGNASATANFYCGMTILITTGTGKGQARLISGYTTGRVATVTPVWTTTPSATAGYILFPVGPAQIEGALFGNNSSGVAWNSGAITASTFATDSITSTALAASAVTEIQSGLATSAAVAAVQADTDDIQTRLPAALVSGRMDSSVGAMAANTLTASALASDAVTEIWASAGVELGGVPSATASAEARLQFLYQALRNQVTVTASTQTISNDAGTVIATASVSDDGATFTRGEFA